MKMLFLFLLMLIARVAGVDAQSDFTKLSVTYEVHYQKVEEVAKREKDLMRLDIGEHSSQYISIIGEFLTKNKSDIMAKRIKDPYAGYTTLRDEVFKNTPNKGYLRFVHMPGWVSCREKIEGLFDWQLQDGDSIVCGYPCHKATTIFRGRIWTVWYTLDLPYSDGPWKFCGLPGLVLYAYDSEDKFRFNCIGIEKGDGHEIKMKMPKSGVIDTYMPERVAEIMMMEYWDRSAHLSQITGMAARVTRMWDAQGNEVKISPQTRILYEKFPGVNLKKKYSKNKITKKKK
jgi:GLPGLI family protein